MAYPFQQQSVGDVRRKIGYLVYGRDHFVYDAATSGTTTTVVAEPAYRFSDGHWVGYSIYAVTGANAGKQRQITAHVQATGTVTFHAFPNAWALGDTFELWPADVEPNMVRELMDVAVQRAADVVAVPATAVPTLDSTRKIATIPATLTRVYGIDYVYNGLIYGYERANDYQPFYDRGMQWAIRGNKLYLTQPVESSATDIVIYGYRLPAAVSDLDDDDLLEVRGDFVMYMTAFMLEAGDVSRDDPEASGARSTVWLKEAMQIRDQMQTAWQPNTVMVVA